MRIRTIKPTFWKSETMASVTKETRLLAVALLNYADDEGYFMANDALVRGECFPFDDDSKSVRRGLQELSAIGYIALGNTSDGQRVGRIPNFLEHQRVDKASPSKIKQKTITWDDSTNPPRKLDEASPPEVGSGSRKGIGSAELVTDSAPPVALIPLVDGSDFPVTAQQAEEWARAFPAVNVTQKLQAIRAWCLANPKKRKTRKGVMGFVVSWLGRDQDKGGTPGNGAQRPNLPRYS